MAALPVRILCQIEKTAILNSLKHTVKELHPTLKHQPWLVHIASASFFETLLTIKKIFMAGIWWTHSCSTNPCMIFMPDWKSLNFEGPILTSVTCMVKVLWATLKTSAMLNALLFLRLWWQHKNQSWTGIEPIITSMAPLPARVSCQIEKTLILTSVKHIVKALRATLAHQPRLVHVA